MRNTTTVYKLYKYMGGAAGIVFWLSAIPSAHGDFVHALSWTQRKLFEQGEVWEKATSRAEKITFLTHCYGREKPQKFTKSQAVKAFEILE